MNAAAPLPVKRCAVREGGAVARLPLVLLFLAAVGLAVLGGQLFIAGIAGYQAQVFLDDWSLNSKAPSENAIAVAKRAAERALAFYPGSNGDYYDRLGQVEEWQAVGTRYGEAAAQPARQAALEAYRRAVEIRPDWPYSWVQLATIKLRMLEFDEEFDAALSRSFETGPWLIAINSRLAEIGLVAWSRLDEAQQEQTLESARRTAEFSDESAQLLVEVASDIGRADLLCQALPEELRIKRDVCLSENW